MAKISIIIPAYNEGKSIGKTLVDVKNTVKSLNDDIEIIVVNDGSSDNTCKLISSISGIKIIEHNANRGYGASLKEAIKKSTSEFIMIIDADGTYPASAIPLLISHSKNFDMVVGARTGTIVKMPFFRKPAKWFLKHFAQYLTKTKIPDLNSGLRIFKRDIAMRFMGLFPEGFSFTTTLTMVCLTNDYGVKYLPINYYERKGKSTISPARDFLGFTNLIFRLTIFFKPLSVFIPISALIFVAGVLKLIRDFLLLQSFGQGGAMAILAAIQIAFLGILAELIIKRTSV